MLVTTSFVCRFPVYLLSTTNSITSSKGLLFASSLVVAISLGRPKMAALSPSRSLLLLLSVVSLYRVSLGQVNCASYNSSCSTCVSAGSECLWCSTALNTDCLPTTSSSCPKLYRSQHRLFTRYVHLVQPLISLTPVAKSQSPRRCPSNQALTKSP